MTREGAIRRRLAPAAIAAGVALAVLLTAAVRGDADDAGVRTVELRVEHSLFTPSEVTVAAGATVRFVVVNTDPIGHELIVGDDEVHARHASGTHAHHPPVPGEVSVPPLSTAETTYRFDDPGRVVFACHLPGHAEHGMAGVVTVVDD